MVIIKVKVLQEYQVIFEAPEVKQGSRAGSSIFTGL